MLTQSVKIAEFLKIYYFVEDEYIKFTQKNTTKGNKTMAMINKYELVLKWGVVDEDHLIDASMIPMIKSDKVRIIKNTKGNDSEYDISIVADHYFIQNMVKQVLANLMTTTRDSNTWKAITLPDSLKEAAKVELYDTVYKMCTEDFSYAFKNRWSDMNDDIVYAMQHWYNYRKADSLLLGIIQHNKFDQAGLEEHAEMITEVYKAVKESPINTRYQEIFGMFYAKAKFGFPTYIRW